MMRDVSEVLFFYFQQHLEQAGRGWPAQQAPASSKEEGQSSCLQQQLFSFLEWQEY